MTRKKSERLEIVTGVNLIWFGRATVLLSCIMLILRWVGSFFPDERLWGINHLAYFSPQFAIALTFLGLLLCIPSINRGIRITVEKTLIWFCESTIDRSRYLWYGILSLASIIPFVVFSDRTHFLGDGRWLVALTTAPHPHIGWSEPLEYLVHIFVYRFVGGSIAITGFDAYALVSYVTGAAFVFLAFLLADLLGENKIRKAFVLFIMVTMGGVELFFGHVEHYALSYIFILGFIIFGIKSLSGRTSLTIPSLFLILAVFSHFSSLYLLPAFIFLYLASSPHSRNKDQRSRWGRYGVMLPVLLVVAALFWYIANSIRSTGHLGSFGEIFVPLTQAKPNAPGYTLFSTGHLLDVLNEQLLLSPAGAMLLLNTLLFIASRRILKNSIVRFLIIITSFQLAYGFFIDPILGAAGDWDLFSATALGYTILAIYLFFKLTKDTQSTRYVASVLVVTSLVSTAPWVLLNADSEKSIQRTRMVADLDPKRSKGARSAMWAYFKEHGMREEASKERTRMMEGIPELVYYSLGLDYANMGQIDSAMWAFGKAIEIEEFFPEAHHEMGKCYTAIGRLELAILEFQKALSSRPKNKVATDCYLRLAQIYTQRREFDKAAEMCQVAAKGMTDSKERLYQDLGHCYFVAGELDKAISMYHKALGSNPDFVEPHMYLGHVYLQKGIKDKAIEEYTAYLKHATDAEQIERIKAIMARLNQQ